MKRNEYNGEFDVFETPDHLWNTIEKKLDRPKKSRRKLFVWSGIAATLLIGFLITNQMTEVNQKDAKAPKLIASEDCANCEVSKEEKINLSQKNKVKTRVPKPQEIAETKEAEYDETVYYSHYNDVVGNTAPLELTMQKEFKSTVSSEAATETYMWSSATDSDQRTNYREDVSGSTYDEIIENDFIRVANESQSTFSIDVDGASYSDVRGMIGRNTLPPPNAVRLEEFINYFPYNYKEPTGKHPFSMHSEVVDCPWNAKHQLMKIGIKGKSIPADNLPKNNLVFLLDVSGSMMDAEKLDLLKKGFALLVQELREEDKVSICVYAGAAGMVLPPTSGKNKDKILDALSALEAGGSTAGGEGIELAYATAEKNFIPNGNNRVILATDGDFNVGVSDDAALVKLIEKKRKSGVFLTVLGFGHDNFQSSKMEKLANKGNGNFAFIDNLMEAKKVLVTEMGSTLQAIAKDVKIQLDFNEDKVQSYRLIGYENRMLENEDFSNDQIDAGELGAGHTVTAVYEIVPFVNPNNTNKKNYSKLYGAIRKMMIDQTTIHFNTGDFAVLKFRYKHPNESKSNLIETTINSSSQSESTDMKFISSVIEFGLILRNSQFKGNANYERVLRNAKMGLGLDPYGYRSEFISIVKKAEMLSKYQDLQ